MDATETQKRREALGRRIRAGRQNKEWTQHDLAQRRGHTIAWLSDIERGRNGIDVFDLEGLAFDLELPLDYFLGKANFKQCPHTITEWVAIFNGDSARAGAHYQLDRMLDQAVGNQRILTKAG